MLDLIVVFVTVVSFVLLIGFTVGCDHLQKGIPHYEYTTGVYPGGYRGAVGHYLFGSRPFGTGKILNYSNHK